MEDEQRDKIAKKLIDSLRRISVKMRSGEPLRAVRVTVEHTPDGPLTTREEVVIKPK